MVPAVANQPKNADRDRFTLIIARYIGQNGPADRGAGFDPLGQDGIDISPAGQKARLALRRRLLRELDPEVFVQIHRSVLVNLHFVSHVKRQDGENAALYLKDRSEIPSVSRTWMHLFKPE